MNREDIIRMAREAGGGWLLVGGNWSFRLKELERFAAIVAAAEREKVIREIENAQNKAD